MEETDSDPGPAALLSGLGLCGLHPCYGLLEVGCKGNSLKATLTCHCENLKQLLDV